MRKILRYLQYAGLLLGFGCASVNHVHHTGQAIVEEAFPVELSLANVANKLPANVLDAPIDAAYISPTEKQLVLLLADVKSRPRKKYLSELYDCDDIAREFRVRATDWAVRFYGTPPPPAGLACATLYVKVQGVVDGIGDYGAGGLHVMVAIRRDDGVWFLIEPSNCGRTELLRAVVEGTVEVHHCEL